MSTEVAAAGQPKKRTFRKYNYRGADLDVLIDMSTDDLVQLIRRGICWVLHGSPLLSWCAGMKIRPGCCGCSVAEPPLPQRWTAEEEAALIAGAARRGIGNWRTIPKDPEFSSTLCYRSNVDLKDKWHNMNVIVTSSSSREKGKTGVKKTRPPPKNNDQSMTVNTATCDADEEIADVKPIASVSGEAWNNSNPEKSNSRLDNVILEAIKNLKEATGSHRTTIASYIEQLCQGGREIKALKS